MGPMELEQSVPRKGVPCWSLEGVERSSVGDLQPGPTWPASRLHHWARLHIIASQDSSQDLWQGFGVCQLSVDPNSLERLSRIPRPIPHSPDLLPKCFRWHPGWVRTKVLGSSSGAESFRLLNQSLSETAEEPQEEPQRQRICPCHSLRASNSLRASSRPCP